MLKRIKSSFIMQKIFYGVNFGRKLNLVVKNKRLQKFLNINLTDIRRQSGKYIIGERNGKGKEYNSHNDELIFEGEYLNGKRNGRGKEYDKHNKLKFEGEYLKGKRNGKGKEYKYGELIYEGEYLNGDKSGKGKEYFEDNRLKYEG